MIDFWRPFKVGNGRSHPPQLDTKGLSFKKTPMLLLTRPTYLKPYLVVFWLPCTSFLLPMTMVPILGKLHMTSLNQDLMEGEDYPLVAKILLVMIIDLL